MVTDGYMHLRRAGILKREVNDEKSGKKTFLHGAFYLGSKEFYQWIREMSAHELQGLRMSRVSKINDLYDPNEILLRKQRKNARFLNTCMQVTLLGGAASETLENGQVVSGVGGQYNFVAMSAELQHSKSILMLRSTRKAKGKRISNIVWDRGQLTIPRHLRDTVITEYGIADLKGRSDEECIQALICIADSEFQSELLQTAKENGKLAQDYVLPEWARDNTPASVGKISSLGRKESAFAPYPFGSDFTPEEERIAAALSPLKSGKAIFKALIQSFSVSSASFNPELKRMGLEYPRGFKERLYRRVLLGALQKTKSL
jgi:acyl-CoA hydrolase